MRSFRWVGGLILVAAAAAAQTEWRREGPFLSVVNDVAFDPENPAVRHQHIARQHVRPSGRARAGLVERCDPHVAQQQWRRRGRTQAQRLGDPTLAAARCT